MDKFHRGNFHHVRRGQMRENGYGFARMGENEEHKSLVTFCRQPHAQIVLSAAS